MRTYSLAGRAASVALGVAEHFTFPRLLLGSIVVASVNAAFVATGGRSLGEWLLYPPGWFALAAYCAIMLLAASFWDPFSARPMRSGESHADHDENSKEAL
jgi:hypothetical protein